MIGKKAACHPSLFEQLENGVKERIVVDGNCIASQCPGTVFGFALKLIELLINAETAEQIAASMVIKQY